MLVISRTPIVRAPLLVVASGLVFASGSALAFPDVFVDENATGLNNGTSWLDAYIHVQDGLGDADPGETVFVAKGTYYPDECNGCGPFGTNDQRNTFNVPLEVVVEGGYAGLSNNPSNPFQRNFVLYETILSADILQDDLNSPAHDPGDIVGFNSFHVLTIVDTALPPPDFPGTVVDGFTITAGNANLPDPEPEEEHFRVGGGAFVAADYLIVIPPLPDGPKFQNCIFVGNRSEDVGGALACADVGVEVRDCLILNNETVGGQFRLEFGVITISGGGGIAGVAPFVLVNSRIVGNKCFGDGGGGGVSARHDADVGEIVFASCLFAGNEALMDAQGLGGMGGGARIQTGEVMNCAFTANEADLGEEPGTFLSGGGLRADATVAVYLSSFYGNDAPNGGGGGVAFTSTLSRITNSIAWGNTDFNNGDGDWRQQIFSPGICPTWSNIQDWDCGVGQCVECNFHNICADPYFVDPDGPDDMLGTKDDHLRLRLNSPSFDKGSDLSPLRVPLDSGDVDDDTDVLEELPWDLQGNTRKFDAGVDNPPPFNFIIDQGAYEAPCFACPWDLDGDGTVGVVDLLILQGSWGQRCKHANFRDPDTVGTEDLNVLLARWGNCSNVCTLESGSGPSPELEAATQLMGFADSAAYGEWMRNEATDQQAEVSLIVLIALMQD